MRLPDDTPERLQALAPLRGPVVRMCTPVDPAVLAAIRTLGLELLGLAQQLGAGAMPLVQAEDVLHATALALEDVEAWARTPERLPSPEALHLQVQEEAQSYAMIRAKEARRWYV